MSDKDKILRYLFEGKPITAKECFLMFGSLSLVKRICDLRQEGFDILKTMKTSQSGRPYAEYRLSEENIIKWGIK